MSNLPPTIWPLVALAAVAAAAALVAHLRARAEDAAGATTPNAGDFEQ